jgi:hypothetical protein
LGKRTGEKGFFYEVLNLGSGSLIELRIENLAIFGEGLSWSPDKNLFAYGEHSGVTDVPEGPNEIYLFDVESATKTLLASSPGWLYREFRQSIWSPNFEMIALSTQKDVCILRIAVKTQDCFDIDVGFGIVGSPIWSPDSNFVLVYIDTSGEGGSLVALDIEGETIQILLENTTVEEVFWR